jgi:hypothetical protein
VEKITVSEQENGRPRFTSPTASGSPWRRIFRTGSETPTSYLRK